MTSPPPDPKPGAGKFAGLAALVGTATVAILIPLVQRWEGTEYVPYKDVVGIWTVCTGDTSNVTPGRIYTKEECEERLERQLIAHALPVRTCVPALKDKPNALAASASLAYNVGPANFCRSTAAKHFRSGQWKAGCDAFLNWNSATYSKPQPGRKCRRLKNGRWLCEVRGLTNRRNSERQICLRDAP